MLSNCGAGKILESPLDCKQIKPFNPKGNKPEYSLEGLMLKLKVQYFGYLILITDSLEKTPYWERLKAGGEGATEDEIFGWHHRLNGHEFVQALGEGEGQRSLMSCSPWGLKGSDMTEGLK